MKLRVPRAILFDMDGTLIDTERTAGQVLRDALARFKITPTQEESEAITGRKWEYGIEVLFKSYGPAFRAAQVTPEMLTRQVVEAHRRHLESLPSLPLIPGSPEAVQALCKQLPIALVSGSQRGEIQWAMSRAGIFDCFRFVMGAEDYRRSKPAPDGYLAALGQLGVKPEEALIFEDSEAGIASGLAAGATVVAVTYAGHAGKFAPRAHARIQDFTQDPWSDLARALESVSSRR